MIEKHIIHWFFAINNQLYTVSSVFSFLHFINNDRCIKKHCQHAFFHQICFKKTLQTLKKDMVKQVLTNEMHAFCVLPPLPSTSGREGIGLVSTKT